ncbi:MAG: hypothetical protein QOE69_995 [Thermoleophilaceae bacterium]|jgi:predicted  nucleic acid-binding Zn-ribbon protein|nr:hypothetical protein [Thermoleophilaceae bacterium]
MERARWTDDQIEREMSAIDQRSKEVSADLADLRGEVRAFRTDMRAEMHELRAEIIAMRRHFDLILTGFAVGLVGLIGASQL